MKILDLFCGRGGWSKGFAKEGFEPVGVDIKYVGYPYEFVYKDVRFIDLDWCKQFPIIVGGPPCRDFSIIAKTLGHKWSSPPNPKNGLELVDKFLEIVDYANPKYWLMENVPGLCEYLALKPKVKTHLGKGMLRCFWGDFPPFLIPRQTSHRISISGCGRLDWKGGNTKMKSWIRAEIPLCVSRALARAIKQHLEVSELEMR